MSSVDPDWYQFRNAVFEENYDKAELMLGENRGLLEQRNSIGETVLHFLAVENFLPGIQWLHSQGASLNTKNDFGTPLIFEVALLEYHELYVWLIRNGADPNYLDSDGQTIAEYLAEYDKSDMATFVSEQQK